jgi:hypothetical protein
LLAVIVLFIVLLFMSVFAGVPPLVFASFAPALIWAVALAVTTRRHNA